MTKSQIKRETKRLYNLLAEESARHEAERGFLVAQLRVFQKQCDHKGQKTGYNERDGSWGNPCPTCGYSY